MAKFAGLRDPVTLDFENSTVAYCVDAFCISMGALMGTSPVTAFVESATGISEGGKTGITAVMTGIMFFVSVFFAPIFASIPSWATGSALVIVGSLMMRNVREINWDYVGDSVPAFLTLIMIPLTYNIAYGVIAGIISYALLNFVPFLIRKATNDRIRPPLYENGEKWQVPPGGFRPLWMRNVARGNWRVWEDDTPNANRGLGIAGGITFEDMSPGIRSGFPPPSPMAPMSPMSQQHLRRSISIEEGKHSSTGSDTWEPGNYEYPPRKFGIN